jgi:hypothetical protein
MKLKELLSDNRLAIEYRTIHPEYGDILTGSCHWNGTELIPDDGDIYSIEDEIEKYVFIQRYDGLPDDLTIWYKSDWV